MKYFITGGCGFIGTNLALSFNQKNYNPYNKIKIITTGIKVIRGYEMK